MNTGVPQDPNESVRSPRSAWSRPNPEFQMDRHRQTVRVGRKQGRSVGESPNHKWGAEIFSNAHTGRWARENSSRGLGCSLLESDGSEACSPYGRWMDGDPVLRAQNLSKKFGAVAAVVDVSLVVRRGEIFGFLGPNGAGKTTTISMLLGLTHPSGGTVEILGERVTPSQTAVLHQVGTLVGDPALLMPFTARQNLRSLAYLYPEISDRRIDTILEEVGLSEAADRPARTLSTGMKQRLGLALALVTEPKLLILDEPANGLDPAGIHELRTLFRSLADKGVTIFLSSHQLHEVELICGRVAVVNRGSLVAEGTVAELTKRSGDRVAITTSETARTADLLRLLPNARDISVTATGLEVAGVPSELVLQHLVTHGATPKEVSVKHQDLEEMFLELTRSEPPVPATK